VSGCSKGVTQKVEAARLAFLNDSTVFSMHVYINCFYIVIS
jgi:hypothetical protein